MRLLAIASVVCFIIALACHLVPGTFLGEGAVTWALSGAVAFSLDHALGERGVYHR